MHEETSLKVNLGCTKLCLQDYEKTRTYKKHHNIIMAQRFHILYRSIILLCFALVIKYLFKGLYVHYKYNYKVEKCSTEN